MTNTGQSDAKGGDLSEGPSDTAPPGDPPHPSLRRRTHDALFGPDGAGVGARWVNRTVVGLVLLSILAFVLSTEPRFPAGFHHALGVLETCIGFIFGLEYTLRLWSVKEQPRYAGPRGRLRYALRPIAIIDLLAFAPTVLTITMVGTLPLRALRFVVLFRLMRLGRYGRSLRFILDVLAESSRELMVSLGISIGLLVIGAMLLWMVEGDVQPEAFGSIPRAMWWAVATLTTVGYGDVYPITALGRILAAVVALLGIGMVALPTGILAGAFMEAIRERREKASDSDHG